MNFDSPRRIKGIEGIEDNRTNAVDHPRTTVQIVKPNPWKHIPISTYIVVGSIFATAAGTLIWGRSVLVAFFAVMACAGVVGIIGMLFYGVWLHATQEAEREAARINHYSSSAAQQKGETMILTLSDLQRWMRTHGGVCVWLSADAVIGGKQMSMCQVRDPLGTILASAIQPNLLDAVQRATSRYEKQLKE